MGVGCMMLLDYNACVYVVDVVSFHGKYALAVKCCLNMADCSKLSSGEIIPAVQSNIPIKSLHIKYSGKYSVKPVYV